MNKVLRLLWSLMILAALMPSPTGALAKSPAPSDCKASRPVIAALWSKLYQQQYFSDRRLSVGLERLSTAIWEGEAPSSSLMKALVLKQPNSFRACLDSSEPFRAAFQRQQEYKTVPPAKLIDGGSTIEVTLPVFDDIGSRADSDHSGS